MTKDRGKKLILGHDQQRLHATEHAGQPDKMELLQDSQDAESSAPEERTSQIVVIALGNEYYGIHISSVLEILKVPKITWLPCCPEYIAGVINVRGNIQSVVNANVFLQLGTNRITEQSRIVLVESGEFVTGLLVDEMLDILDVPENSILPLSEPTRHIASQYIEGKFHWHERTITILHIDAIVKGVVVDQQ